MTDEKKFLSLVGTSYLKDKIIECLKDYTDSQISQIILQYDSILEFPNIGNENTLYIDKSTNKTYRWDDTLVKYYCTGSDYNNINVINGGTCV